LSVDVWHEVAAQRVQLADRLEALGPGAADAPSWCEGWRVRDVLGHLVHLAEGSQLRMARAVLRHGPSPDRALAHEARVLGDRPVAELTARLRAGADHRFHVLGSPRVAALAELLVHGPDMLRPLGYDLAVDPQLPAAALGLYRRVARLAFHAAPAKGVTLVATDADAWLGSGPVVEGRAIDLLLLLSNRRQVIDQLTGPGVAALR
jgi:uncharacterized protein (TIGR03083 family)